MPKPRFLLALSLPVFSLLGCTGPTSSYPLVPRPSDETCLGPSGGASEADVAWPELVDRGLELGLQERDRRNRGAAAADFNADGYPDLWLANPHDPASLFLSDGDGGFDSDGIGACVYFLVGQDWTSFPTLTPQNPRLFQWW